MTENHRLSKHWDTLDETLHRWINERQELILLLCAINGLKEYTPAETPVSVKIQAFCQIMMDYISAGHFEVYKELINEAEAFGDPKDETLLKKIYSRIELSTEIAVEFNDDYDSEEHCVQLLDVLPTKLSELGEVLGDRFELEDKLIDMLHNRHKPLVNKQNVA